MSKRKKLRGGRLGVLSEREFFETFGPKPKPPRPLTWGETLFGYQPGTNPVPPQPQPQPPQAQAAQPVVPAGQSAFIRRHPPVADARRYFDPAGLWGWVFIYKDLPQFRVDRPGVSIIAPIYMLTEAPNPGDQDYFRTWQLRLAAYFDLPDQEIKYRNPEVAWDEYLGPFISQIEKQINLERPPGMKGNIFIRPDEDGNVWIVYYE